VYQVFHPETVRFMMKVTSFCVAYHKWGREEEGGGGGERTWTSTSIVLLAMKPASRVRGLSRNPTSISITKRGT
jgi:hypothetical protein